MSTVSKTIVLPNGQTMPTAVFGVYQIQDPAVCRKAVEDALEAGYRAIDTAVAYGNEAAVGAAIKASGLPRDEIFVTSKLWIQDASEKGAAVSVERSLELMGLDTPDLYLLHQPVGDVYGAWRTLERLHEEGVLAAIGVSNFAADRLMDFALHQKIRPMVNQIEINPFCQQAEALPVMKELGVVPRPGRPLPKAETGFLKTRPSFRLPASTAARSGRSCCAECSNSAPLSLPRPSGPSACAKTSPSTTSRLTRKTKPRSRPLIPAGASSSRTGIRL